MRRDFYVLRFVRRTVLFALQGLLFSVSEMRAWLDDVTRRDNRDLGGRGVSLLSASRRVLLPAPI